MANFLTTIDVDVLTRMAILRRDRVLDDIALGSRRRLTNLGQIASNVNLPIVVAEHGDLSFFDSKDEAEGYLEVPDIVNLEFEIFDAEGRPLRAEAVRVRGSGLFGLLGGKSRAVRLIDLPEAPLEEGRLRALLTNFIQRSHRELGSPGALTLHELIARAR